MSAIIKVVVGIVAFPLMGMGLVGAALWLMVDGESSPLVIRWSGRK